MYLLATIYEIVTVTRNQAKTAQGYRQSRSLKT